MKRRQALRAKSRSWSTTATIITARFDDMDSDACALDNGCAALDSWNAFYLRIDFVGANQACNFLESWVMRLCRTGSSAGG